MAICNIESSFIESNLKYEELIPVIEECMATVSRRLEGEVDQPVRTVVTAPESNGCFFIMPVYSKKENVFTTKIVTLYPDNKSQGLPSHHANIWLYDGATGVPKATLDGHCITLMRTAAASAVATKYLAPKNSKIHTILGAGDQALSHFEALNVVCNFEEVRIWNHNYPKAEAFAKEHGGITAYQTAEEAVRGADVITTVTLSSTPVLFKDWVKKGAHINAVGAPVPDKQEIEPALMRSAAVYADTREAALKESGDVIKSKVSVFAEIGEVVLGKAEAKQDETTIFKSLGMAMEDLVSAKLVYDIFTQLQTSH